MLEEKLVDIESKIDELTAKLEAMNTKINRIDAHTIIIGCQVGVSKLCKVNKE